MYDEPIEDPADRTNKPVDRALEKVNKFRMHAELAAVFEGVRKFDAQLYPGFDPQLARDIQRRIGKLEKAKSPDRPILPPQSAPEAADLLNVWQTQDLSTGDYHIHRRPGEVMIFRWLQGDQVETYYERLQAHFDAAMEGCREDERQSLEWKKEEQTQAYLAALDAVKVKMADIYLREPIQKLKNLFVLSTQTADEINIAYLCDYIMNVPAAEVVGKASAPPDNPTDGDLAWFFKLFSLRGMREDVEQMLFFTFLQKSGDAFEE